MSDDTTSPQQRQRKGRGRIPQSPPRGVKRRDETTIRAGVQGITAVAVATLAISAMGAMISLIVALLY